MAEITSVKRGDQAEGLRRMLNPATPKIIVLASAHAGVGKTSVAINLAAALATTGLRVLLIDENHGPANIASYLGLPPQSPKPSLRGALAIETRMLSSAHGLTVLPLAEVSSPAARTRVSTSLKDIENRFDVVLADTACNAGGSLPVGYGSGQDTIVVSTAAAQSITASYAMIKRLCETEKRHRVHVVLNRVIGEDNARVILNNLAGVARANLKLSVQSLGSIPKDQRLNLGRGDYCPAVAADPVSAPAARYRHIADAISAWPYPGVRSGFIERFMQCVLAGNPPAFASAGV